MFYLDRDVKADKENKKMKKMLKNIMNCKEIKESDLLNLIGKQKSELNVESRYYEPYNIAEGNWSLLEDDQIKKIDKNKKSEEIDATDVIYGIDSYDIDRSEKYKDARVNDAEYEYVFKPSFYAVFSLIFYYLNSKKSAERIFNLKVAVLRKKDKSSKEYYGGLPFVLKYLNDLLDTNPRDLILSEFIDIMDILLEHKHNLAINNCYDEFLNDIIDCINNSGHKDFILLKRVKDCEYETDKFFKTEYMHIDGYNILLHRDVKKDWKYLEKAYIEEANEKIKKTPKHPFNDSEKDSEKLKGKLKEWYSQRIGEKDRLVYKKDKNKKVVYIATVCDHYKDAEGRTKSTVAYR